MSQFVGAGLFRLDVGSGGSVQWCCQRRAWREQFSAGVDEKVDEKWDLFLDVGVGQTQDKTQQTRHGLGTGWDGRSGRVGGAGGSGFDAGGRSRGAGRTTG